ncbi:S41 family peptidase [Rhizobium herbae]|uniref:C-terminal processing protease CtpA/Prc n=1 Tax=Rhizobium herbae TaxID=508661 RepID=A0ABS4EUE3_9HYPH|nr:S41 family peptidase [Rhizobium herbae]MBP1861545.1 C-terminal processing protease CtpA/Prc [Rhizobium herbae]
MTEIPKYDGGSLEDLINGATDSAKATLSNGHCLREFLSTIDHLEVSERELIVDQAITLLEDFYVHLPMKRAMHAVDPLQRLRLLRRRLKDIESEITFHHEMTEIFTSLRDMHTNYILPSYFARMIAFLPFRVARCFENDEWCYIMAEGMPGFDHQTFRRGTRILYWNGVPIERAIEIAASYHAGSNTEARRSRGVAGLTRRAMNISPPPDEEWVDVGYEAPGGELLEFRCEWIITNLPPETEAALPEDGTELAAAFGIDLEGDTYRRINKLLFGQHVIEEQKRLDSVREEARNQVAARMAASGELESVAAAEETATSNAVEGLKSTMPDVFTASVRTVAGRNYGYLRIATFSVTDDRAFVNEFLRLIEHSEMPQDGLIIDVRGNGGGLIWAGERLLQLLTPKTIEPSRVQFISSAPNQQLCTGIPAFSLWAKSLERAMETGAAYSAAFPITPPERCNDIGQRYYGNVVLITDARCYSTTDIFAAGFQDHGIGIVLGVDNNTGAGGANVWTLDLIRRFFKDANMPSPLQALPKDADMRVAIRRTLRVRGEAGTELEDLGVKPDRQYRIRRNDILKEDTDLIAAAASIIREMDEKRPQVIFKPLVSRSDSLLEFSGTTHNLSHLDIFVNQRPLASHEIVDARLEFTLPLSPSLLATGAPVDLEMRGYAGSELACCRLMHV